MMSSRRQSLWVLALLAAVANAKATAKHGAVATESQTCSDIGGDILKAGGTAADAMIASVLCVGTVGFRMPL